MPCASVRWPGWLSRLLQACRRLRGGDRLGAGGKPGVSPPAASPDESASAGGQETPSLRVSHPEVFAIGPYRVERVLGRGAMGAVFLGRDKDGVRAAVKTMALAQEFDAGELAEVRARFFREAETAARLDHPQIVRVLGAGEDGGLAYLAMEFLDGGDLVPFTRPDRLLPALVVAGVVARVTDALDYAHRHQVVHRDVKPSNIMYDPATDRVRVADFGVARLTDASKTKTGMVLGTPSYMSPEQLLGKKVDGRSDLFSLGVVLYQMLCGRLPFVDTSLGGLMRRIVNEPPPDIRSLNPELSETLVAVVERALRKDGAQRYPSGAEMVRDLRASCQETSAQRPAEPLSMTGGERVQ